MTLLELLAGLAGLYVAWRLFWAFLRSAAVHQTTCVADARLLGRSRSLGKLPGTCVIAGGSLAGLLAAKVASSHFEKVVLIEPDPEVGSARRSRISHSLQIHAFHELCLNVPAKLFPGFEADIQKAGGRIHPLGWLQMLVSGDEFATTPEQKPLELGMTRMGYENVLRKRTMEETPGLEFIAGSVTGLESTDGGRTVTSVSYKLGATGEGSENKALECALFVDASGTASAGLKWFEKLELGRGQETTPVPKNQYLPNVTYASAIISCSPKLLASLPSSPRATVRFLFPDSAVLSKNANFAALKQDSWAKGGMQLMLVPSASVDTRHALIFCGDGNTITLGASFKGSDTSLLPHDCESYADWIDGISLTSSGKPAPAWAMGALKMLHEAAKEEGGPEVKFNKYKVGTSYVNRYDQVTRWLPSNFVAVGDALCKLNPAYGQGVIKLCSDVVTLNAALHSVSTPAFPTLFRLPPTFTKQYFDLAVSRSMPIYSNNKSLDLAAAEAVPMDKGDKGRSKSPAKEYVVQGLMGLAYRDPVVAGLVSSTTTMARPMLDLMHPVLLLRALWERRVNMRQQSSDKQD